MFEKEENPAHPHERSDRLFWPDFSRRIYYMWTSLPGFPLYPPEAGEESKDDKFNDSQDFTPGTHRVILPHHFHPIQGWRKIPDYIVGFIWWCLRALHIVQI